MFNRVELIDKTVRIKKGGGRDGEKVFDGDRNFGIVFGVSKNFWELWNFLESDWSNSSYWNPEFCGLYCVCCSAS